MDSRDCRIASFRAASELKKFNISKFMKYTQKYIEWCEKMKYMMSIASLCRLVQKLIVMVQIYHMPIISEMHIYAG
jgi:hypothetical protein